jgi:LmbE family N-acetylglucosaminyl deacetylase
MEPFLMPGLRPVPQVLRPADVPPGRGRTLLLVIAHADDAAIFAGGVLALFAAAGWRIHALRVTDDRWDSVALDAAETVARNAAELRAAAALLGIAAVEDLMWHTDVLGNADRVALRGAIVRVIRRERPHSLMTFDPDSLLHEDNLDHRVLARAVDEAFWTAMFDKHYPDQIAAGLAPHGCVDRWYFGRSVAAVTHVFDTASVIDRQMQAVACHATPIANMAAQFALQARTAGRPEAEIAAACADPAGRLVAALRRAAAAKGAPFGLAAAEHLRCHAAALDAGAG